MDMILVVCQLNCGIACGASCNSDRLFSSISFLHSAKYTHKHTWIFRSVDHDDQYCLWRLRMMCHCCHIILVFLSHFHTSLNRLSVVIPIPFHSVSHFFFRWITLQIVIKMFVPYFIVDPSIPRISSNFRKISDWKTDCMLLAAAYHWICVWIHTWNINIFDEATCRKCGSGSMPCGLSFIWFLQCLELFVV